MGSAPEMQFSQSKRLIVCCDGTWDDSTSDYSQPPTNVTRICRALSRNAVVEENGSKKLIPQIVYYQKGVGSGIGNKLWGGAAGVGLSARVRAAYAFLAENYNDGDKIYFFGFSRGAYTARATAGLVTDMGLLTSRGMDNFSTVYNDYYNHKLDGYDEETRRRLGFRDPLPRFTVEIVGVWDTVGFHDFWFTRWLFGEEFELPNTRLSKDIRYAFHALSLDEQRTAFQPTLWYLPEKSDDQELLQVWFSGEHSDVGGGANDPRLSNIALAWMIAQCTKHNQLSFDLSYFFDEPAPAVEPDTTPWATSQGPNRSWSIYQFLESVLGGTSVRRPLRYGNRKGDWRITNEALHESIQDRNCFGKASKFVRWPCKVLKARKNATTWLLSDRQEIHQVQASDTEKFLKGRIRTVHPLQVDPA
ncbi:hypothetical protein VTN77DRAFT_3619 [Rasamsonia byssochlamydoides]|uniref:uncharacterized protein n=1 Tax=Rasamsonia byssochlamydoides TaxID=89139 RepID=UPI00374430FE